jgi:hypothetical protein
MIGKAMNNADNMNKSITTKFDLKTQIGKILITP